MSKNRIFKNDEELNKALDEVTEVYSKPPTRSEYIFIFVLLRECKVNCVRLQ